ncbi:MAG: PD40 domain-containing protein [Paludibacteraceae bacterium]|nr:PD40 domain-containing protein [Paludibacteraceae bacterium]
MKSLRWIIVLLLPVLTASCGLNARIAKADKKFALGEYFRAAELYNGIYTNVPRKKKKTKGEVAFKLGNAYRLIEQNKKAEQAYKNAVRNGCKDSLLTYYYAEVLRQNGKYNEALKLYSEFAQQHPDNTLADNGVLSCRLAGTDWKTPTRYEVTKAPAFNSRFAEFCPAFASADGDVLYFNSNRGGGKKAKLSRITGQRTNDIYTVRTNVQGDWEEPIAVEGEINTEFDEGTCSFSPDGQEMLWTVSRTAKGETLGTAIYSSKRSGGAWTDPVRLRVLKDSTLHVAHPAVSPDGRYLYFVSDMPGGYGGKDIWRVEREGDGFGEPENAGPSINTAADEMFPYFRSDGSFYFASDGHPGLGGLDIFKATPRRKLYNEQRDLWDVVNMQRPINSNADDFGITFAGEREMGFFSSNRGDRKYYDHIFKFEIPPLVFSIEGVVTDTKGEPLSDAVIRMVGDNGTIASIKTKKNGSYSCEVQKNTHYVLMATCRGFLNSKETLELDDLQKSASFLKDFQLASVTKPVKMHNIFYQFGSAELTPESSAGLDDLVKLLNDNPNIAIEVGAHTDYVGSEQSNEVLSRARAQSVVNYLLAHGIEQDRVTVKGYGESVPVTVDRALVKQYRFLKVGQVLDEAFITKLPADKQELCNQINRRTEFKVTKTTYKLY